MISHNVPDACLRCGGWLQPGQDDHGKYIRCLNCGRYRDLLQPPQAELDLLAQFPGPNARRDVAHAVSTVR